MKPQIEQSQFVVLKKLTEMGRPMSMLEIGFTATPFVIRNMAARGMVRVMVEITPRGTEAMEKMTVRKARRETQTEKRARLAAAAERRAG